MANHRRVWEMDDQEHLGGLPAVPSPKLDDPEDVAWALSTAEAMWSRGEHADSIRWIRKAAESASEADYDTRALELAKAAAELATVLRQESAPNVNARAESLVEQEVSAELRDARSAMPHMPAPAAAPPAARIIGTAASKGSGSPAAPPGPPPRTLKVTSSSSTLSAVSAPKTTSGNPGGAAATAPTPPKAPSLPPPAPAAPASSAATPSSPPPAQKPDSMPPTTRVREHDGRHDNPTRPRGRVLTPTDVVHVPHLKQSSEKPNPDATTELNVGRELRAMVKEMAAAQEPPPPPKPSRPPPPPAGDSAVRPSQAVHVIVWRDAAGVHVAPAGTVVSSITVDAMLVALDPNADLSAWLEARKPR